MNDEDEHATHMDCGTCYGTGYRCLSCGGKGVIETQYGRERREDAEEYRAEQRRDELMREDWDDVSEAQEWHDYDPDC